LSPLAIPDVPPALWKPFRQNQVIFEFDFTPRRLFSHSGIAARFECHCEVVARVYPTVSRLLCWL
jgi:hypothetical protein